MNIWWEKVFIITKECFQKSHVDDKRCHAYNEGQACKRQRKEKRISREVLILDETLLVSLKKPQTQKLLTIKRDKKATKSTK